VKLWTGNNVGYFGPFETELRGHYPYGPDVLERSIANVASRVRRRRERGAPLDGTVRLDAEACPPCPALSARRTRTPSASLCWCALSPRGPSSFP
jgi:hypothetical protein